MLDVSGHRTRILGCEVRLAFQKQAGRCAAQGLKLCGSIQVPSARCAKFDLFSFHCTVNAGEMGSCAKTQQALRFSALRAVSCSSCHNTRRRRTSPWWCKQRFGRGRKCGVWECGCDKIPSEAGSVSMCNKKRHMLHAWRLGLALGIWAS